MSGAALKQFWPVDVKGRRVNSEVSTLSSRRSFLADLRTSAFSELSHLGLDFSCQASVSVHVAPHWFVGLRPGSRAHVGASARNVRSVGAKETDMTTRTEQISARSPKTRVGAAKPKSSEKARLEATLRRPRGATQRQLEAGLSWQPHSIRAAISVLRKEGRDVVLDRSGKTPTYRIDAQT